MEINILILFFILFILFIIILYYSKNKTIESFITPKKYILEDCESGWGKKNNTSCTNNAWVRDPRYLCGICGEGTKNVLHRLLDKDNERYYGCSNRISEYGLQWNKKSIGVEPFLSDLLTCNTFNINVTSDIFFYICCDDNYTITVNGQTGTNNWQWYTQTSCYFQNIKYGDVVTINGTNICGPGGICVSYFWNKQLFILDNNGFETNANIIDYEVTGFTKWSDTWATTVYQLLPWMKNWLYMEDVSCNGGVSYMTVTFKVGYTQNRRILNNDLNIFWGCDDYADVLVNNEIVSSISGWNAALQNVVVPNVNIGSSIVLNGTNTGGPGSIALFYLWCGVFYCLPSTIVGFNNCINILQFNSVNTEAYTYDMSGQPLNVPFLPMWLNTCYGSCTFSLTNKLKSPNQVYTWTYPESNNKWYAIQKSVSIGKWITLGITSNLYMTVSFWSKITTKNGSTRNIFHVSNQNVDCCTEGNRVPKISVQSNSTSVKSHYGINNSRIYYYDRGVKKIQHYLDISTDSPLNTPTFVTISWNNKTIKIYSSGILKNTINSSYELTVADTSAPVYIGDPWNTIDGGVQIKDFMIQNKVLTDREVTYLYEKTMKPAVSSGSMDFQGNGCCRFDGFTATSKGYLSEDSCKTSCLDDPNCVAADMARPNSSNQYDCYNFFETKAGASSNIVPECGTTDPTQMCYKKNN